MSSPVEQAQVDKVAEAIWRADINTGHRDFIAEADVSWAEDIGDAPKQYYRRMAVAAIEALQLTEEWAVSSGERRQFDNFGGDRDAAERGLYCAVTNNEHWQEKGREIPLWARNPRIERRLVGPWRTAEENQ